MRQSVLRQHHPLLLKELETKEQQEAVIRAARRQHGAKAAALAKAATAKGQMTLTSMFRVVRKTTGGAVAAPARASATAQTAPKDARSGADDEGGGAILVTAANPRGVIDLCTPDKQQEQWSPPKKARTPAPKPPGRRPP